MEFQHRHSRGHISPWPIRWKHSDSTVVALERGEFSKSLHSRPGPDGSWCSLTYLLRPRPFSLPALPCAPEPTIGFRGGTPCSSSRGSPVYHNGLIPPEGRSGLVDCTLGPARAGEQGAGRGTGGCRGGRHRGNVSRRLCQKFCQARSGIAVR